MAARSRPQRLLTVALAAASLLVGGLACELFLRQGWVKPRIQIIRSDRDLRVVDGVPVWSSRSELVNEDCPAAKGEGSKAVAIFGDSIFSYGAEPFESLVSVVLQGLLDHGGPRDVCVLNFSQPGFSFDAKFALARLYIPRFRPRIVYWGVWLNETAHLTLIGDSAYNLHGVPLGPDGVPAAFHLPARLNRWLFTRSRLFEYATLVLLPIDQTRPGHGPRFEKYVREQLPALVALARQYGSRLVLVMCPPLDRSFARSLRGDFDGFDGYAHVIKFAEEQHVPLVRLERELEGKDFLRLRKDELCHYNSEGHRELAQILLRDIRGRLN